jgi:hypothetical protein
MQNMLDTIVHHANAEDEATGDAFEIFHFRKVGNRRGQIRVPRQEMQSPKRSMRYSSARMQRCRFASRSWIRNSAKSSGLSHETDSYMPLESAGAAAALGSLRPRG